jgi:DNA-binding transcriptional MerR regulator
MERAMRKGYQVGEVAGLTGVSVRTLHHYDRIGLLRPQQRTAAGYRLYGEQELLRLQQILTLRYLGFSLKRIGELLDRPNFDLAASLRVQERVLRERMAELEGIATVLGELVTAYRRDGAWNWDLVIHASEAVATGLAQQEHTMSELFTPEQLQQFAELAERTPAEEMAAIQDGWAALLPEVHASYDLDPASPEAQALAERWDALTARTMRAYESSPELVTALRENYAKGAFEGNTGAPQAADFAFLERIRAARG